MAHSMILQEGGMLTTLTAAVVLPLQEDDQYVVCVCNVGDSLAYVYSPAHGVREITQGIHIMGLVGKKYVLDNFFRIIKFYLETKS